MPFFAGAAIGKIILDATGWTDGAKKVQSDSEKLKNGLTKLSTVAAGALALMAVRANEFTKRFANVSTLVDAATVDVGKMEKGILGLDSRLGSATELTEGLYQALSASVEPAKAVEAVGKSAEFARAALTETNKAVDVGTTVLNAYGKSADELGPVFDKLFTVIKLGKVTGDELASTIGDSIPLAANLGVSVDELGASIAIMTRQGIKAANATTQFNGVINALLKPSDELQAVIQKLGFASGEAAIQSIGFKKTIDLITEAAGGSKENLALMFRNTRALRGVLALTGKGAKDFNKVLNQITNSAGATSEAFNKQELTFDSLKNEVDKLLITLGKTFLPLLYDITKAVSGVVKWVNGFDDSTKSIITTVIGVVAAIGPAIFIVTKFSKAIAFIGGVVPKVISAMGNFSKAITFLAANPIAAAVLAVGGLVAVLGVLAGAWNKAAKAQERRNRVIREGTKDLDELNATIKEQRDLIKRGEKEASQTFGAQRADIVRLNMQRKKELKTLLKLKKELELQAKANKKFGKTVDDGSALFEKLAKMVKKFNFNLKDSKKELTEFEMLLKKLFNIDPEKASIAQIIDAKAIQKKVAQSASQLTTGFRQGFEGVRSDYKTVVVESLDEQNKLIAQSAIKTAQRIRDTVAKVAGAVSTIVSAVSAVTSQFFENEKTKIDNDFALRKEALEKSITNEEDRAKAIEKLEKEKAEKEKRLRIDQFNAEKGLNILRAISNTAVAVTSALTIPPPFGQILAGVIGGLGAAQVALIAAQDAPAFADGGNLTAGTVGLVGENGPELVQFNKTGNITPNQETANMLGGRGITLQNNFLGPVNSNIDFEQVLRGTGEQLRRKLRTA